MDLAVGPAASFLFGPVFRDRPIHTGIVIDADLVLSKAPPDRRPSGWNQLRLSSAYVPRSIWISPAVGPADTGVYGVSFRPIGFSLPVVQAPFWVTVGAGVLVTYLFVHSRTLPSPTHFLRPGLDPSVEIEVVAADPIGANVGWTSQLYVPQAVGGNLFAIGPVQEAIWHVGQLSAELHFVIR